VSKPASSSSVTDLLLDWRSGNAAALEQLLPLVYNELRRVAQARLRDEAAGHTLQATALVHEAYVRLVDLDRMTLTDRTHFFAMAARLMRRILVDAARARRYQKRGGGAHVVSLDEALTVSPERSREIVALDDALKALAEVDIRKSQVIELRYFGGLSVEETAAALDVSPDTVMRDWRLARAWLLRELSGQQPDV